MMNTIVIANKKGGVGKTTTAQNLASALARKGMVILALDMDAQSNLSRAWGVTAPEKSVLDALRGKASWKEASLPVEKHENGCVLLVPAVRELAALPELFAQELGKEFLLKEALSSLTQAVDAVIIDSPPALDLLAVNCYVAADRLLVPAQCEFFSLEGLKLMRDDMRRVQARLNPGLDMLGVVPTLVDRRKRLCRDVLAWLGRLDDGWKVTRTVIRDNVALAEAPSHGQSIFDYDARSNGAQDYALLAEELTVRLEGGHHGKE